MKKLFLLLGLALASIGIHAEDKSDLNFLGLYGPVSSVSCIYVDDVYSTGKAKSESVSQEKETYFFDKKGQIKEAYLQDSQLQIIRDKQGTIQRVVVPNRDGKDGFAYNVIWNEDGKPKSFVYDLYNYTACVENFIYGGFGSLMAATMTCSVEESEGWETMTSYQVLERDEHFNWTKRLEISIIGEEEADHISYTLQLRKIRYHD